MPSTITFDVDLIVFDLDGTLADSLPDLAAAANYACRRLGLPEHAQQEMGKMIGGGEANFVRRFLGPEHQDRFAEALELYISRYEEHSGDATRLYPGVPETLARLAGRRLAVLSNKMERLCRRVLAAMGIAHFFAAIKGGDSYGALKPSPLPLLSLAREVGVEPSRVLMVGDKPADVLTGREAGARTVAVTYGYGELEALTAAGPDAVLPGLTELPQYLG
jgi:phosphoglycolate phosphatase